MENITRSAIRDANEFKAMCPMEGGFTSIDEDDHIVVIQWRKNNERSTGIAVMFGGDGTMSISTRTQTKNFTDGLDREIEKHEWVEAFLNAWKQFEEES